MVAAAGRDELGSAADPDIRPPGLDELPARNRARAHLLGRQLRGSGDLPANLMSLYQYLFNPFTPGQDGNLLAEKDRVQEGSRQTGARFSERLPLPPFPDPGGVPPLGRTDNGDELYWITQGNPDGWPVALLESRAARQEVHPVPATGFLAALAANQLTSRILPGHDAKQLGSWGDAVGHSAPPLDHGMVGTGCSCRAMACRWRAVGIGRQQRDAGLDTSPT